MTHDWGALFGYYLLDRWRHMGIGVGMGVGVGIDEGIGVDSIHTRGEGTETAAAAAVGGGGGGGGGGVRVLKLVAVDIGASFSDNAATPALVPGVTRASMFSVPYQGSSRQYVLYSVSCVPGVFE